MTVAAARDDRRGPGHGPRRLHPPGPGHLAATRSASWPTAFNQMAADLAAADRQRRELIANVSHELRTPITALQGLLENIVDGVAEAEPATMQTALTQTERLGRLVTELLDLSRLDAGVVPLARDPDRRAGLPRRRGPGGPGERGRRRPGRALRGRPRRPWWCPATGNGCTRSSPTCWTTRPGTARPAAPCMVRAERRDDHAAARGRRRGRRASRRPTGTGSSNASPAASGRPAAAPGWGWPSPAGWSSCTAARSPWSTRTAPRGGCHIHVTLPLPPDSHPSTGDPAEHVRTPVPTPVRRCPHTAGTPRPTEPARTRRATRSPAAPRKPTPGSAGDSRAGPAPRAPGPGSRRRRRCRRRRTRRSGPVPSRCRAALAGPGRPARPPPSSRSARRRRGRGQHAARPGRRRLAGHRRRRRPSRWSLARRRAGARRRASRLRWSIRPMPRPAADRYGWAAATVALLGRRHVPRGRLALPALPARPPPLTGALAVAGGRSTAQRSRPAT